jgi:hypothetical protein
MKAYLISSDPDIKATLVIKCDDEETFIKALNNLPNFWTTVGWFDFLIYKITLL